VPAAAAGESEQLTHFFDQLIWKAGLGEKCVRSAGGGTLWRLVKYMSGDDQDWNVAGCLIGLSFPVASQPVIPGSPTSMTMRFGGHA
jgi:hypothetical protein